MIADCAIDPDVFAVWRHFQSLHEDFGVGRGRLISAFPSKWKRSVSTKALELVQTQVNTDMQATRIVERLSASRFRLKMKPSKRDFPAELGAWAEAVRQVEPPFDLVITSGVGRHGNWIGAEDLLKDEAPFFRRTQDQVDRSKEALMGAAKLLVSTCENFIIVDPNFRADEPRFHSTLLHLIELLVARGVAPMRLEIHTNRIRQPGDVYRRGPQLSQWRTHIEPELPAGWKLTVCYWDQLPSGGRPHARFLLTELGGLYYDHGLDEGLGQTLVTLLEEDVWEGLFRTFDARSLPVGFDAAQHVFTF